MVLSKPKQILVIALMGIPPSVFFGMAGALITAMIRTQPTGGESTGKPPLPVKRSDLFIFVLILSAIGYLSPFYLLFKPRPKQLPSPIVNASPLPRRVPQPPPKWHYQKPLDFDKAEAAIITIVDQKIIDDINSERPVAMSPDGLRFAYCERKSNRLLVRDLETLDIVANEDISPASLAWESNSTRLLIQTDSEGDRSLHVSYQLNGYIGIMVKPEAFA